MLNFKTTVSDTTKGYFESLPAVEWLGWEGFLGSALWVMVLLLLFALVREGASNYMLTVPFYKRFSDKWHSLHPVFVFALSLAMCYEKGFDMVAAMMPPRPVSWLGVILTATPVARGPEAVVERARKLGRGAKDIKHEVDEAKKEGS